MAVEYRQPLPNGMPQGYRPPQQPLPPLAQPDPGPYPVPDTGPYLPRPLVQLDPTMPAPPGQPGGWQRPGFPTLQPGGWQRRGPGLTAGLPIPGQPDNSWMNRLRGQPAGPVAPMSNRGRPIASRANLLDQQRPTMRQKMWGRQGAQAAQQLAPAPRAWNNQPNPVSQQRLAPAPLQRAWNNQPNPVSQQRLAPAPPAPSSRQWNNQPNPVSQQRPALMGGW